MTTSEQRMAKLLEEEAQLEALVLGTDQGEEVLGDEQGTAPDEPFIETVEVTMDTDSLETAFEDTTEVHSTVDQEELASLRKELADITHRFNRYKGTTDKTMFEQRTRISDQLAQIANLQQRLKEADERAARLAKPDDDIPEEVADVLGEETVTFLKNNSQQTQKELAELKRQREQDKIERDRREAEQLHAENVRAFQSGLRSLVPDYEQLNTDQKFVSWLQEADDYGSVRIDVLRDDQARGDYVRVAQFFNEYKQTVANKGPVRKEVSDSVDQHIGPQNSRTGSSNQAISGDRKGFIKMSDINKFNKQVAKGMYKYETAKAEAMEARIFKATQEGKLIFDEKPL